MIVVCPGKFELSGCIGISGLHCNPQRFRHFFCNPFRIGKFMLPDANNLPALMSESPCNNSVALFVARQFFLPKRPVVFWHGEMHWAEMPKTAIHKQGDPFLGKYKIRLSEQGLVSAPAGNMMFSHDVNHRKFCIPVAPALDTGHDLGSFFLCEDIRHDFSCAFSAEHYKQSLQFALPEVGERRCPPGDIAGFWFLQKNNYLEMSVNGPPP